MLRALELGGQVLLVCDRELRVLESHGSADGAALDGALEPSLAEAVRSGLETGGRHSPFPLRGCPDFRLLQVDVDPAGQVRIWLKRAVTSRLTFGKVLRERYGFKLRSQQLLLLLTQGLANREIAAELGLREATVKTYLHEVYETLGVRSRTAAIAELRSALHLV